MSEGAINEESIAANFWMENRMSGHRQWSEREDCESDVAKFLNRIKAEAWDEGAEYAWQTTGEGWNGEYAGEHGTHDGEIRFAQANGDHNPYREDT